LALQSQFPPTSETVQHAWNGPNANRANTRRVLGDNDSPSVKTPIPAPFAALAVTRAKNYASVSDDFPGSSPGTDLLLVLVLVLALSVKRT